MAVVPFKKQDPVPAAPRRFSVRVSYMGPDFLTVEASTVEEAVLKATEAAADSLMGDEITELDEDEEED